MIEAVVAEVEEEEDLDWEDRVNGERIETVCSTLLTNHIIA